MVCSKSLQEKVQFINLFQDLSYPNITMFTGHVNLQGVLSFKPSVAALTGVTGGGGEMLGFHVSFSFGQITRILSTNVAAVSLHLF